MNPNICNNCGGDYEYRRGRWRCRSCGAYKPEEISNEEETLLYNAAQKLRVQEFSTAEELYLDIIQKYPKQHEAYWGYVCARYGIKVEENFDGRRIPTCCFPTIESFTKDQYFKKAVDYAPPEMVEWYNEQAAYIERVRTEWIEKAKREKPYDIFISYKDSDIENGIDRTKDSVNALELYNHLARQGYNVFYSRESLRDKTGEKYEPYIFHALKTAKVMIVYTSSADYINSTWVKNEWHRYLKQTEAGEKSEGSLLVVCDGFSPNELPKILSSKQCLDGTSKMLYVDIDRYLKKIFSRSIVKEEPKQQVKINPLHEHTYTTEVVPASCIAKGYTIHRCNCGYEYKDAFTNLADHKYEYKTTKKPTCTDAGYKEYTCLVCGEAKRETIPANGHTFDKWIEQTHPTCNQPGKKNRQCKVCGYVETGTISPRGHQYGDLPDFRDDAQTSYCVNCGQVITIKSDDADFEINGHTLVAYKGNSSYVTIPSYIRVIGECAFSGNTRVRSVIMTDSVREIQKKAFQNCYGLEDVIFSENLQYIRDSAFANCKSIKKFDFPTSLFSIGQFAFYHCESITKVELPPSLDTLSTHLFDGCSSLTDVVIPFGVKNLDSEIFWRCTNLKEVTVPASVTSLKGFVFAVSELTDIYFENADNITFVENALFWGCKTIPNIHASENFKRKFGKYFSTEDKEFTRNIEEFNSNQSGGCYIATCIYGAYDCPQVWTLRRFRDDALGLTWYGRAFIHIYYAISPVLVKCFGQTSWFRKMWRGLLDCMVEKLQSNGVEDTPYEDKEW